VLLHPVADVLVSAIDFFLAWQFVLSGSTFFRKSIVWLKEYGLGGAALQRSD
jgi:hypothetical protein